MPTFDINAFVWAMNKQLWDTDTEEQTEGRTSLFVFILLSDLSEDNLSVWFYIIWSLHAGLTGTHAGTALSRWGHGPGAGKVDWRTVHWATADNGVVTCAVQTRVVWRGEVSAVGVRHPLIVTIWKRNQQWYVTRLQFKQVQKCFSVHSNVRS